MGDTGRLDMKDLRSLIRSIPDYPKPGILFRDVTTLFGDPEGFKQTIDTLVDRYRGEKITKVAGIDARGFILGGAMAYALGIGFVPIRKQGKLPHATVGQDYALEYGTDRVEMHIDAVSHRERVVLVDDLIATGGTAEAAAGLLVSSGAEIVEICFVIDLPDLGGRARLEGRGYKVFSMLAFDGH